jgi:hypothetical protein
VENGYRISGKAFNIYYISPGNEEKSLGGRKFSSGKFCEKTM